MGKASDMVIRELWEELDSRMRIINSVKDERDALREDLASANSDKEAYAQNAIDLRKRAVAAEQRNAELVELLHTHANHVATLCDVMFRFGLGMHKEPEQKIYSALAQQQVVFAALKPTESGASEAERKEDDRWLQMKDDAERADYFDESGASE